MRLGRRASNSICGTSSIHLRPVNMAMATAIQKNVWATAAWAEETHGGWNNKTVRPPSTACVITVPRAAMPSHFIQRRRSANHVQAAIEIVSITIDPAIARWVHSNLIPPCSGGTLKDPKEVGQSGMESPASLLVTRAPAMIRTNVAHAVNTAKPWCARLYGVARGFSGLLRDLILQLPSLARSDGSKTRLQTFRRGRARRPSPPLVEPIAL